MKQITEKSETEKSEDRFVNRMSKPWSVERSIVLNLRPKRKWKEGLTTEQLLKLINSERKRIKKYSKGKIYDSISLINRFGSKDYAIYIVSRIGWVDDKNKNIEHRYFNIKEKDETVREKGRLGHRKEIINIKKNNVEYHERKTLPQEKELEGIRKRNK